MSQFNKHGEKQPECSCCVLPWATDYLISVQVNGDPLNAGSSGIACCAAMQVRLGQPHGLLSPVACPGACSECWWRVHQGLSETMFLARAALLEGMKGMTAFPGLALCVRNEDVEMRHAVADALAKLQHALQPCKYACSISQVFVTITHEHCRRNSALSVAHLSGAEVQGRDEGRARAPPAAAGGASSSKADPRPAPAQGAASRAEPPPASAPEAAGGARGSAAAAPAQGAQPGKQPAEQRGGGTVASSAPTAAGDARRGAGAPPQQRGPARAAPPASGAPEGTPPVARQPSSRQPIPVPKPAAPAPAAEPRPKQEAPSAAAPQQAPRRRTSPDEPRKAPRPLDPPPRPREYPRDEALTSPGGRLVQRASPTRRDHPRRLSDGEGRADADRGVTRKVTSGEARSRPASRQSTDNGRGARDDKGHARERAPAGHAERSRERDRVFASGGGGGGNAPGQKRPREEAASPAAHHAAELPPPMKREAVQRGAGGEAPRRVSNEGGEHGGEGKGRVAALEDDIANVRAKLRRLQDAAERQVRPSLALSPPCNVCII